MEGEKIAKSEPQTFIHFGPSGSGKTCAARRLAKKFNPVLLVVVNGNACEFARGEFDCPVIEKEYGEVPLEVARVCYIIEDVQKLTKEEKASLFTLFNVTSRRLDCQVHVVTHAVQNTGVYGLVVHSTDIIFTSHKINLGNVKMVMSKIHFPQQERVCETFMRLEKNNYLRISVRDLDHEVLNSNLTPLGSLEEEEEGEKNEVAGETQEGEESDGDCKNSREARADEEFLTVKRKPMTKETLLSFFSPLSDREGYPPLVDFIFSNMPLSLVRSSDFSIATRTKSDKEVRISLLDYLHCLNTPSARPSKEIGEFHAFLQTKMCFPDLLVKNNYLCKRQN